MDEFASRTLGVLIERVEMLEERLEALEDRQAGRAFTVSNAPYPPDRWQCGRCGESCPFGEVHRCSGGLTFR